MSALKAANLALAFLLEIGALLIFVYWGLSAGPNLPMRIVLGVSAPAVFVAVWGAFAAPRARFRLQTPVRLAIKWVLFGLAALSLASTGHPALGLAFAGGVVVNFALAFAWRQN